MVLCHNATTCSKLCQIVNTVNVYSQSPLTVIKSGVITAPVKDSPVVTPSALGRNIA